MSGMAKGLDYSDYPHPSMAAIKAEGASFVCRYACAYAPADTSGKNLLAGEKAALLAAGISIVIVHEETADRMLGGSSSGAIDATHADAVVKALGMPGVPVYFACDFDSTTGQQAAINSYLDGAASVIGRGRVGIYGGYYPVKRSLDAGKAAFAWQTFAWSGGQWDTRAQLRQVQNEVNVGGADCDRDISTTADYGQWPRPNQPPAPPTPTPLAPAFPYPAGHYLGQPSTDPYCHSGFYGGTDTINVRIWQTQMSHRGWTITADGRYGDESAAVARGFQADKGLTVDGRVGPVTWAASWTAPVT
jgi:peptidoglycan hydrolase-like protein with peptidoglycan-binding domain